MERWILGRLRNRRFYGLAELNEAIRCLLVRLNDERLIRRLGETRRHLLEELDRPMLKPLPVEPYVFAEWRLRRAGIDYCFQPPGAGRDRCVAEQLQSASVRYSAAAPSSLDLCTT